jgi:hypothetical protein
MGKVSTIGLDIAKSVFQVHGVDADGAVVIRQRIGRAKVLEFFAALPPCVVGIEACPSAHHWSRKLRALGHTAADRFHAAGISRSRSCAMTSSSGRNSPQRWMLHRTTFIPQAGVRSASSAAAPRVFQRF